jgi:hypothetical protein
MFEKNGAFLHRFFINLSGFLKRYAQTAGLFVKEYRFQFRIVRDGL